MTKQLIRTLLILSLSTVVLLASCLSVTPQTFVAVTDSNDPNAFPMARYDLDMMFLYSEIMNDHARHQTTEYRAFFAV